MTMTMSGNSKTSYLCDESLLYWQRGRSTVKKEMKITECDDGVPHIGKARKELLQQLACEHGYPDLCD